MGKQIDLEAALNDFAYVSLDATRRFGDCEGQKLVPLEVVPIAVDNTEQVDVHGKSLGTLVLDELSDLDVLEDVNVNGEVIETFFDWASHCGSGEYDVSMTERWIGRSGLRA